MTAPLADIMRGHDKLDGCCIHNNIRQLAFGVPADAQYKKRTLWVGPTLVFRVILWTDTYMGVHKREQLTDKVRDVL